jgi:hypothetical protein
MAMENNIYTRMGCGKELLQTNLDQLKSSYKVECKELEN